MRRSKHYGKNYSDAIFLIAIFLIAIFIILKVMGMLRFMGL